MRKLHGAADNVFSAGLTCRNVDLGFVGADGLNGDGNRHVRAFDV